MCHTLIVEDNPTFRKSLRDLLCAKFPLMNIMEAADGREAMQRIDGCMPDLIFMDIKLPGVNGLELTRRIRADNGRMSIVILTSYDLPEYREAAFSSGADYFLVKGKTTSDEITALVELIIDKSMQIPVAAKLE